eukprot:g1613.t1
MAAVLALKGNTLAEDNVLDSEIGVLTEDAEGLNIRNKKGRFIAVYTDDAQAKPDEQRVLHDNGIVDLCIEYGVTDTMFEEVEDPVSGEKFVQVIPGIPHADRIHEFYLDLLGRQIKMNLSAGSNRAAEVFRDLFTKIVRVKTERAGSARKTERVAAQKLTISLEAMQDPQFLGDVPDGGPFSNFLELLAGGDADDQTLGELIRNQIPDTPDDLEKIRARNGLTLSEMKVLGFGYVPDADETSEISRVDIDVPGIGPVEVVGILSPNGDMGRGVLLRGGFTDQNQPPSDDLAANVLKALGVTITIKDGQVTIEADVIIKGDVKIEGDTETEALQSVEVILSTDIGSRVMRRSFGGGVAELLGRGLQPRLFAAVQQLIGTAIDLWEPRLHVRRVTFAVLPDLSTLPKPEVIEEVDYEVFFAELAADIKARFEAVGIDWDVGELETDSAAIIGQAQTYRELSMRQRMNYVAQQGFLYFATAGNLDQLTAWLNVTRMDGESDERLKERYRLATIGRSAGGPAERYRDVCLGSDLTVRDVAIWREGRDPTINVAVLSSLGTGEPTPSLLQTVEEALTQPDVQVVSDRFSVQSAIRRTENVELSIRLDPTALDAVADAVAATIRTEWQKQDLLGLDLTRAFLIQAADIAGVTNVEPNNATPAERAMDLALAPEERLLPSINSILTLKHITRPSGILPFLVFEFGLESLRPYVPNLYDLIDAGRQWARYRGTHKAVHDGLGFIGYAGDIVDPPERRIAWADFQVALDRLRDTEEDLIPIDGIVGLSSPVRSKLRRVYYGHDIPAAESGFTRQGNCIWGDDSGVRIDGSDVKWSFGRDHEFTGALDQVTLEAFGAWLPPVSSDFWVDANFLWADANYEWANSPERARRSTILTSMAQNRFWIRFEDQNADLIGYRKAQAVPVRSGLVDDFRVDGLSYSRSNDDPTHLLIHARTGFGDGSGQTAKTVSIFGGTVLSQNGIAGANDRFDPASAWTALVYIAKNYLQPSEFNEMQSRLLHQIKGVGNLVAADGDRRSGGDIVVTPDDPATTATVQLGEGMIYVGGLILPVPARTIAGVAMSGDVSIGVRVQTTYLTHEDEEDLLGIDEGTESFGEPGAVRELRRLQWSIDGDGLEGEFAQVYLLRDGGIIDQGPPPALTGVLQQLSGYDFDSNGHYIVEGCNVVPLGKVGADQVYSIAAGIANIRGWKRVRESALRLAVSEDPELEPVDLEPHTYVDSGDGSTLIDVHLPPIATVDGATVTKQVTEVIVRGADPGGTDLLGNSSIVEIVSVEQSASTFDPSTYALAGNGISWANGGAEPAQASSYSVTYLYYDAVVPDEVTDTTIRLSGGVPGQPTTVTYQSKKPRIDAIGLDQMGAAVYINGVSARKNAVPAKVPSDVLKLAEVEHDWQSSPIVTNNGTKNYTYDEMRRFFEVLLTVVQQFDRSEQRRDIQARDSVARDGIFTDLLQNDFYRDEGEPQTAAINRGVLQLAIDGVDVQTVTGNHMLDWQEEVVLFQRLSTRSLRINPYANFLTMPGAVRLEPASDFWTDHVTEFASAITREFTAAPDQPPGRTTLTEEVSETVTDATTLRRIDIDYTIEGFAANEEMSALLFDGIDITPDPAPVADLNGEITGTLTIPALVPTGVRLVRAEGVADSFAEALFVGQGTFETEVMRRVNLVTRAAPPPEININITNITNVTQNVTNVVARNGGGGGNDPLAQTFSLQQGRHIAGVNVRIGDIGDPNNGVRVQLCTVLNGYPTNEIIAEDFLSMQGRQVGDVLEARWDVPVYLPPAREFCFVVLTDDAAHALSIARMGDVDPDTGNLVGSQPYTVGTLFSSANRTAWTAHQEEDLWFELIGARFNPTEKTVDLWTGTLTAFTDLLVRGAVEVPTAATSFRYELHRANGLVIRLAPEQPLEFDELVDEEVTLRAVLGGSATESPILWSGTTLIAGRVRDSGTYITKEWKIKGITHADAILAQMLPPGSSVTVEMDMSPHFNLPIPDEGNLTSEEFVRLRNMVLGIEGVVKSLSDTLDGKAEAGHDHQISGVQGLQSELTNLSDAIAALQSPTLASLNDVDVSSATNGHVLLYLGASWQAAKIAAANVTYGGAGSVEGALDNIAVSLDGKAATLHQHTIAQVTGLQAALDGKASTADLAGKLGATATAQNSNQLGGLSANQFLRANAGATKTAGHLTFNDSIYARFGTGADLHWLAALPVLMIFNRIRGGGMSSLTDRLPGRALYFVAAIYGGLASATIDVGLGLIVLIGTLICFAPGWGVRFDLHRHDHLQVDDSRQNDAFVKALDAISFRSEHVWMFWRFALFALPMLGAWCLWAGASHWLLAAAVPFGIACVGAYELRWRTSWGNTLSEMLVGAAWWALILTMALVKVVPVLGADFSQILIIETSEDASAGVFPVGEPVRFSTSDSAMVDALGTGLLADAVRGINDQLTDLNAGADVTVVRVAEGVDTATTAASIADVVNNITSIPSKVNKTPRIVVAGRTAWRPDLDTTNPVIAALEANLGKILAVAPVDVDDTSTANAIDARETMNSERLIPIGVAARIWDGASVVTAPMAPRVAGLMVRIDNQVGGGLPFQPIANRPLYGLAALSRKIPFSTVDGSSEGQQLLAANVSIVAEGETGVDGAVADGGYRFIGTDNAMSGELWEQFHQVRGTDYIVTQIIEITNNYLGRRVHADTAEAWISSLGFVLRDHKASGNILGHTPKHLMFKASQNSPENIRLGTLSLDIGIEPVPVFKLAKYEIRRWRPAVEGLEGSTRANAISKLVLPPFKLKNASHTPGGGVGTINAVLPRIEEVEPKFEIKGLDTDIFDGFGIREKWVFAGSYRDLRTNKAVPGRAVIEGAISQWESDESDPDAYQGCTHILTEVIHYEFVLDGQELFYWDFFERELRRNGEDLFAQDRAALGA